MKYINNKVVLFVYHFKVARLMNKYYASIILFSLLHT